MSYTYGLCNKCRNEGLIFGYEKSKPQYQIAWRCDCFSGRRHFSVGIPIWDDKMRNRYELETDRQNKIEKTEEKQKPIAQQTSFSNDIPF